MIKRIFRVEGMHCPNCAMTIEILEDELPGVKSILASYQQGKMVVEYDELRITEGEIIRKVEAQGYSIVPG